RDRFGIVFNLGFYETAEIERIILRSAKILGTKIDQGGVAEIAKRSRGTPRIANRLLRRVRDFAEVKGDGIITEQIAKDSMLALEIDCEGLDVMDRRILGSICVNFGGGPVGIETIAVAVSEEPDTIAEVVEPFLIKAGFLARTPRGRTATKKTFQHLGLKIPSKSDTLF
ncbi:MAG: Holliday junction branch migration DNA helicase RuvB, partial [Elusimicrobia bacterium]|nr:Holliday junction branch migration DNA helicase RuvB [Elusimicrobiota bacterium]